MRVFQQVVDEGGFAAAARRLDLSPAVVTRLVGDLEGALGVRLLNRTTRRLSLTQAGEAYLQRVRLILRDIDEAEAVAQAESRAISGTLRLCAMPVVATHLLAPAVAQFQQMHPGVVVDINVSASPESTMEEFDLTVLADAGMLAADLVVRPIVDTQRVLCASPEYLRREGTPREPADLAQHRWLHLSRPGARPGHLALIDSSQADHVVVEVDLRPVLMANDVDTLLRATAEGAGISIQSLEHVAPLLRGGQLVRVLSPWISQRLRIVAVLPSRQFLPARTRAFLEYLATAAREALDHIALDCA